MYCEDERKRRTAAGLLKHLWEKNRDKSIPGSSDRLIRALYTDYIGGKGLARRMLRRLADMREREHIATGATRTSYMGDEDRLNNAIGEIERLGAEMRLHLAIQEMVRLAKLLRRELDDVRVERDYWREAAATTPIPRLVHSAGTKRWWWKRLASRERR